MSGHSKWAQIKRKKHATDVKKGAVYGRFSKEITVSARQGADPEYNASLRNTIERAKALGVPNEIIARAISKAQGQGADSLEEVLYEGYGPHGIALLIEASTDNRNRTAAELRLILSKHGGNLGESGCVSWSFRRMGLIYIPLAQQNMTETAIEEHLLELEGLEDIEQDMESETVIAYIMPELLNAALQVTRQKLACSSELVYLAQNTMTLTDPGLNAQFDSMLDKLEELDDVSRVWHNLATGE